MNLWDLILLAAIIAISVSSNADRLFSLENLISTGIIVGILAIVCIIVIVDYGPSWRLRAEETLFYEERNEDRWLNAIETFISKNKLVDRAYLGYLALASLKLYQGSFTEALEALLYCQSKDMSKPQKNSLYILRCKILMFMDQLSRNNPDYKFIMEHHQEIAPGDHFNIMLIRGYLTVQDGKLDKAQEILNYLQEMEHVTPSSVLWDMEIKWLNSIMVLHDYSQYNYNNQYNILKGSHAPRYIIKSIERQEHTDQ